MNTNKNNIQTSSLADPSSSARKTAAIRRKHSPRRVIGWCAAILGTLLVLGWALIPALRAITLIRNNGARSAPMAPGDLAVQEIHFQASDGVHLAGWFVLV